MSEISRKTVKGAYLSTELDTPSSHALGVGSRQKPRAHAEVCIAHGCGTESGWRRRGNSGYRDHRNNNKPQKPDKRRKTLRQKKRACIAASPERMVAEDGIEPPTRGFSIRKLNCNHLILKGRSESISSTTNLL
ncbi:hypothetical protein [Xanthomonas sp. 3498]|uniref:hypothetical protein n=1 Tax=Xanthomonas sp. 3498 TaxID=2663863 RepID=UPI0016097A67|nr:hypothetical protein [Xanthomonas sp. 3498]